MTRHVARKTHTLRVVALFVAALSLLPVFATRPRRRILCP